MTATRDETTTQPTASAWRGDVTFAPGAAIDQTAAEVTPARPRRMVMLHWLTALCLCIAAGLILLRDEVVTGRALKQWLLEGHRHVGLFILLLFLARVAMRIRLGKLPPVGASSRPMRVMAMLTHIALYLLLLAQPLLGWALSNAQGRPVHLLGLTLPALVRTDEDLADSLQAWHVDAAWLLLALVLLHTAAALWHHFVLRDDTLRAMLPRRRGP